MGSILQLTNLQWICLSPLTSPLHKAVLANLIALIDFIAPLIYRFINLRAKSINNCSTFYQLQNILVIWAEILKEICRVTCKTVRLRINHGKIGVRQFTLHLKLKPKLLVPETTSEVNFSELSFFFDTKSLFKSSE